ncbi:hypothetical protein HA466_0001540 [Hirschfeldia incana]|nr:hypothetical protein HA466_0001540 [Hirschfeldia incana]
MISHVQPPHAHSSKGSYSDSSAQTLLSFPKYTATESPYCLSVAMKLVDPQINVGNKYRSEMFPSFMRSFRKKHIVSKVSAHGVHHPTLDPRVTHFSWFV